MSQSGRTWHRVCLRFGNGAQAEGTWTGTCCRFVPGVGLGLSLGYLGGQAASEGLTGGEASTFYDNLGTYWTPCSPAEGALFAVSPAGLAVWNAVEEGFAETEQQQAGS